MMPSSRIVLQLNRIPPPVLQYFRFMSGREVRARVVNVEADGKQAVLRIAGNTFPARVDGVALKRGESLYVRIEETGRNTYSLVLLGESRGGALLSKADRLPPDIYNRFMQFLGLSSRKGLKERDAQKMREKVFSLVRRSGGAAEKTELFQKLFDLLGGGGDDLLPLHEFLNSEEKGDGFLFEEWREDDSDESEDETEQKERAGVFHSEEEGPEKEARNIVMGWGDFDRNPGYFFLQLSLRKLGKVGILITSPDSSFDSMNIFLKPMKKSTGKLIGDGLQGWINYFSAIGVKVSHLSLLEESDNAKVGIDFQA